MHQYDEDEALAIALAQSLAECEVAMPTQTAAVAADKEQEELDRAIALSLQNESDESNSVSLPKDATSASSNNQPSNKRGKSVISNIWSNIFGGQPQQATSTGPNNRALAQSLDPTASLCPRCGNSVSSFQSHIQFANFEYHKDCFRCFGCQELLISSNASSTGSQAFAVHDGLPYHKNCAHRLFTPSCNICHHPLEGKYYRRNFFSTMAASIPLIGFGTWKIPKDKAQQIVYLAIKESNIRHIDCACDYGNEVEVGRGINQAISEGIVKREDLWITSKLWNTYHRQEHVLPAAQRSLSDLGLEYFDLYLVHFPIPLKFVPFEVRYPPEWIHDPSAPNPKIEMDEHAPTHVTWAAMEALVDSGLTRHIGVCNFNVQHIMDLLSYARIKPFANQVELHPFLTQNALVKFCQDRGIHVTAYSPLASYSYIELGGDGGHRLLDEPTVQGIATKHCVSPAQVVLRWGIQRGTSIIPKSSNPAHLSENVNIMGFELTEEEMNAVSGLNKNLRFNDPGVYCAFMGGAIPIFN